MYASMIPTYRYSLSSDHPMLPFDLNEEDQSNHHQLSSSSSSSLSYHTLLFNPHQDQPKHLQTDKEAEKINPCSGSSDRWEVGKGENNKSKSRGLKLKINWKKEEDGNCEAEEDGSSVKWMPSKMDQTQTDIGGGNSKNNKFEEAKQPLSPLPTDNNSSNNMITNHFTVRVCSDCHTTKTPLWRSGPRGPKSLCNACGIRQRKARRAMAAAAAASANGTSLMMGPAGETCHDMKGKKLHVNKEKKKKKLKAECGPQQLKKKHKLGAKPMKPSSRGRKNKFGNFEDLRISLSKNLNLQVFPQDEKEAAILLMALSYGLLHGFPSDIYLDL